MPFWPGPKIIFKRTIQSKHLMFFQILNVIHVQFFFYNLDLFIFWLTPLFYVHSDISHFFYILMIFYPFQVSQLFHSHRFNKIATMIFVQFLQLLVSQPIFVFRPLFLFDTFCLYDLTIISIYFYKTYFCCFCFSYKVNSFSSSTLEYFFWLTFGYLS